ncbi:MAG: hypothetical protein RKE49_06965 [Oceanicaulis sp.]
MKVGLDANLSRRLVDAMNAIHGRDDQFVQVGAGPAHSDAPWITAFSNDGGQVLIGADQAILKRPFEVEALSDSGLHAFFLGYGKANPKGYVIASFLIWWWPEFRRRVGGPHKVFRTKPMNWDYGSLEALTIIDNNGIRRVQRT